MARRQRATKISKYGRAYKEYLADKRMRGLEHTKKSEKARWQFEHKPYTNRRQG